MAQTFHVSEETYQTLRKLAERQGRSPEDLFRAWVDAQSESEVRVAPELLKGRSLARFIGAFEADVPDLVRRHDHYVAEAVGEDHDDRA